MCNGQNLPEEELPTRFLSRLGEGDQTLQAEFIMVWPMSSLLELASLLEHSAVALKYVLGVVLPYESARFDEAKAIARSIAAKQAALEALGEFAG